jgi:hypothetical protein
MLVQIYFKNGSKNFRNASKTKIGCYAKTVRVRDLKLSSKRKTDII